MNCKIVILECNGESHPAICFNLEIARCETRVVFDENEAINLMEIAQHTGELFDCLLVNNPNLNIDISRLVEQCQQIGAEIPVVFVKQSESVKGLVADLISKHPTMDLHFSEPTRITELVLTLLAERNAQNAKQKTAESR